MSEEKMNEKKENETSPIWKKMLKMLVKLEPNLKDDESEIFLKYFAEMEKGSTCLELVGDELSKISAEKLPNLIYDMKENCKKDEMPLIKKPFVVFEKHLFATKYFLAKCGIEDQITKILKKRTSNTFEASKDEIDEYFKKLTNITLNDEQKEAIRRGLEENLIITGGPGTGKTTVVCYLLWKLLQNQEVQDYTLYLAAPSGKAADRLKESISDELSKINRSLEEDEKKIFDKLNNSESYTIHRLLSYNPSKNSFSYNRDNQFNAKSIFVIDEASMIDISLFASLLEAIPDDAIVFILGDEDQLPSVDAGMVLGELLSSKKDSVTELKNSVRFKEDSEIGRLKNAVQAGVIPSEVNFTDCEKWKGEFYIPEKQNGTCKEYPVTYLEVTGETQKEKSAQIKDLVIKWSEKFYDNLAENGNCVFSLKDHPREVVLDSIWKEANSARILCAERRYLRGVEELNKKISSHIIKKNDIKMDGEEFFAGELLMLTKNQKMFTLYNGDTGIVFEVKDAESVIKYLMVKKTVKKSDSENKDSYSSELTFGSIFQIGSYIFYPIYLLPRDSLEIAYSITIHKAQGSGYEAILIFLPENSNNQLLNRQILYTALTRTKGSTYLVANPDILKKAVEREIVRTTMIKFNSNEKSVKVQSEF